MNDNTEIIKTVEIEIMSEEDIKQQDKETRMEEGAQLFQALGHLGFLGSLGGNFNDWDWGDDNKEDLQTYEEPKQISEDK